DCGQADLSRGPLPLLGPAEGRARAAGLQQGLFAALRVHDLRDLSAPTATEPSRRAHRGGREATGRIAWHRACTLSCGGVRMRRIIMVMGTVALVAACTSARTETPPPTTTTTFASTTTTLAAVTTASTTPSDLPAETPAASPSAPASEAGVDKVLREQVLL